VKVFWFFFPKKNRKKALLFEKRSKNIYPITVSGVELQLSE
jgi:hypothetical protein